MIFSAGGTLLFSYPLFVLFASGNVLLAIAAQLGFAVLIGAIGGGLAATMSTGGALHRRLGVATAQPTA